MSKIILFNKPFQVLSQFSNSPESHKITLGDYLDIPNVYPAGRLDYDSEGLLLLTDDGGLQHLLCHPKHKLEKTYWVQVEGQVEPPALEALERGVFLKEGVTQPASARLIPTPSVWDRTPPIRERQQIPTQWLEIRIREGRNRQVRRMTAAVGHPTLRLIRVAIGPYSLNELIPGEYIQAPIDASLKRLLRANPAQRKRPRRPQRSV
jgi:23S rRNA pseudouridine2457 synthase